MSGSCGARRRLGRVLVRACGMREMSRLFLGVARRFERRRGICGYILKPRPGPEAGRQTAAFAIIGRGR